MTSRGDTGWSHSLPCFHDPLECINMYVCFASLFSKFYFACQANQPNKAQIIPSTSKLFTFQIWKRDVFVSIFYHTWCNFSNVILIPFMLKYLVIIVISFVFTNIYRLHLQDFELRSPERDTFKHSLMLLLQILY